MGRTQPDRSDMMLFLLFMELKLPFPIADHGVDIRSPRLRRAAIDWMEESDCDYAITLVFNRELPVDIAVKEVGRWLAKLEQRIRGCRAYRLPPKARIPAFAVPEHLSSNIHVHLALALIDGEDVTSENIEDILEFAERTWRSMHPAGDFKARRLFEPRGWFRYITKDGRRGSQLILGSDFHPNR